MTLVLVARPEATTIGPVLAVVVRQPLVLLVEAAHVPPHEWERMRRGLGLGDRGVATARRSRPRSATRRPARRPSSPTRRGRRAGRSSRLRRSSTARARWSGRCPACSRRAVAACGWPGPPPPHLRDLAKRAGVPLIAF